MKGGTYTFVRGTYTFVRGTTLIRPHNGIMAFGAPGFYVVSGRGAELAVIINNFKGWQK